MESREPKVNNLMFRKYCSSYSYVRCFPPVLPFSPFQTYLTYYERNNLKRFFLAQRDKIQCAYANSSFRQKVLKYKNVVIFVVNLKESNEQSD